MATGSHLCAVAARSLLLQYSIRALFRIKQICLHYSESSISGHVILAVWFFSIILMKQVIPQMVCLWVLQNAKMVKHYLHDWCKFYVAKHMMLLDQ